MKDRPQQPTTTGFMLPFIILLLLMFIIASPGIRDSIAVGMDSLLYPLIGFNASYPVLTIAISGIIMITLSSIFTNIFTDWKSLAKAQEIARYYQNELKKARQRNDSERIKQLMKLQPKILQLQSQSSAGMSKQMIFVILFITPVFIWLIYFLSKVSYIYFTTPWADYVSFTDRNFIIISNWFLFYIIFSTVIGQVIRQILKYLKVSGEWQKIKAGKLSTS